MDLRFLLIVYYLGGEITSNIEAAKDSSIKLSCSDVTPNTYVLLLEWKCVGLCTSQVNKLTKTQLPN